MGIGESGVICSLHQYQMKRSPVPRRREKVPEHCDEGVGQKVAGTYYNSHCNHAYHDNPSFYVEKEKGSATFLL